MRLPLLLAERLVKLLNTVAQVDQLLDFELTPKGWKARFLENGKPVEAEWDGSEIYVTLLSDKTVRSDAPAPAKRKKCVKGRWCLGKKGIGSCVSAKKKCNPKFNPVQKQEARAIREEVKAVMDSEELTAPLLLPRPLTQKEAEKLARKISNPDFLKRVNLPPDPPPPPPSLAELYAVRAYTGDAYYELNRALRQKGPLPKDVELASTLINSALVNLPAEKFAPEPGTTLWRGLRDSRQKVEKILSRLIPGNTYFNAAFLSTTLDKDVLDMKAQGAQASILFKVRPSAKTAARKIANFSFYPQEEEVLFPTGCRFRVNGVSRLSDETFLVELDEI